MVPFVVIHSHMFQQRSETPTEPRMHPTLQEQSIIKHNWPKTYLPLNETALNPYLGASIPEANGKISKNPRFKGHSPVYISLQTDEPMEMTRNSKVVKADSCLHQQSLAVSTAPRRAQPSQEPESQMCNSARTLGLANLVLVGSWLHRVL